MIDPSDPAAAIRAWLHADSSTAGSDRVLAGALARASTIDQERPPSTRWTGVLAAHARLAGFVAVTVALSVAIGVSLMPAGPRASVGGAAAEPSPEFDEAGRSSTAMTEVRLPGATLWFAPPRGSWEVGLKDGLYISKNIFGPQGAEAIILFTSVPTAHGVRPCLIDPGTDAIDALADAVATAPGVELVSGPAPTVIQGRRGIHVSVNVVRPAWSEETGDPMDWTAGCDPGYFFGWEPHPGGAYWLETVPGDTIHAWIADVNGTSVFIQSMVSGRVTVPSAERAMREIQGVVDSVRFDEPWPDPG